MMRPHSIPRRIPASRVGRSRPGVAEQPLTGINQAGSRVSIGSPSGPAEGRREAGPLTLARRSARSYPRPSSPPAPPATPAAATATATPASAAVAAAAIASATVGPAEPHPGTTVAGGKGRAPPAPPPTRLGALLRALRVRVAH